jgi:hypothetical protein
MIKAYFSHPIRGPLKDKATPIDMKRNCDAAVALAERIRTYMEVNYREAGFELYVPAEHEAFVNRAWKNLMLTVDDILEIDCQIIREEYKDVLLVFAPFGPPVEGCNTEVECALRNGIAVVIFEDFVDFKDAIEKYLEAVGIYE